MAFKKRKLSKKEQKAADKQAIIDVGLKQQGLGDEVKEKKQVAVPDVVSVKDFADRAELPVTEIISQLINNGVFANINENIDFETAAIIGDDLGIEIVKDEENLDISESEKIAPEISKNLKPRPPVVTIMGHVDHGKTSLLDKIRQAHVAAGESGGITQHISAYQIKIPESNKKKKYPITFIDTPGHSAFSTMRSHGASIADIVVLIVAANDGVMPQTIEVIEQAKSYNLPIIVAVNKVDLPNADIQKVKQQLSEYELIGEDWGGKTVICEISAKTGKGIDHLLEMIILQSEMLELKADPDELATGVVIESHIHKGAGALAIILIDNGTLHVGDPVTIGPVFGRVRILEDFIGRAIKTAGPSTPTRVAGLRSVPSFGDRLVSFADEREAKNAAEKYFARSRIRKFAAAKTISKDDAEIKTLNIILKADVNGSLGAIKKALFELKHPKIRVKIVSEGVGAVAESDATMAKATGAIILGFRVAISLPARRIIEKEKISALSYDVIYELVDDVKNVLESMLPAIVSEVESGKGEILAEFRDDKKGVVIGARVTGGKLKIGNQLKIISDDDEIWRGKIETLRREKDNVSEVESGIEVGIGLASGAKYTVGDKIIAFSIKETKQTI